MPAANAHNLSGDEYLTAVGVLNFENSLSVEQSVNHNIGNYCVLTKNQSAKCISLVLYKLVIILGTSPLDVSTFSC